MISRSASTAAGSTRSARSDTMIIGTKVSEHDRSVVRPSQVDTIQARLLNTQKRARPGSNLARSLSVTSDTSARDVKKLKAHGKELPDDGSITSDSSSPNLKKSHGTVTKVLHKKASRKIPPLAERMKVLEARYTRLADALRESELALVDDKLSALKKGTCQELNDCLLPVEEIRNQRLAIARKKFALQKLQVDREWQAAKTSAQYDFVKCRADLRSSIRQALSSQMFDIGREFRDLSAEVLGINPDPRILDRERSKSVSLTSPQPATLTETDEDFLLMNIESRKVAKNAPIVETEAAILPTLVATSRDQFRFAKPFLPRPSKPAAVQTIGTDGIQDVIPVPPQEKPSRAVISRNADSSLATKPKPSVNKDKPVLKKKKRPKPAQKSTDISKASTEGPMISSTSATPTALSSSIHVKAPIRNLAQNAPQVHHQQLLAPKPPNSHDTKQAPLLPHRRQESTSSVTNSPSVHLRDDWPPSASYSAPADAQASSPYGIPPSQSSNFDFNPNHNQKPPTHGYGGMHNEPHHYSGFPRQSPFQPQTMNYQMSGYSPTQMHGSTLPYTHQHSLSLPPPNISPVANVQQSFHGHSLSYGNLPNSYSPAILDHPFRRPGSFSGGLNSPLSQESGAGRAIPFGSRNQ